MRTVRRIAWCVLLLALGLTGLAGCNTVHGFGRDLEAMGDYLQEEADDGW